MDTYVLALFVGFAHKAYVFKRYHRIQPKFTTH